MPIYRTRKCVKKRKWRSVTFKLKTGWKSNKIDEKVDKLRSMNGHFVNEKVYFFRVFEKIPKIPIYHPPPVGSECGQKIYRWQHSIKNLLGHTLVPFLLREGGVAKLFRPQWGEGLRLFDHHLPCVWIITTQIIDSF